VGLHQESIARIENGGTVPRLDTVFKIALVLGMKFSLNETEEAATDENHCIEKKAKDMNLTICITLTSKCNSYKIR